MGVPFATPGELKQVKNELITKIEHIGGLPTPANAGDAMVYNGTEWTKQDGYGYTTTTSGRVVTTWDGNTTGRAGVSEFYRVLDVSLTKEQIEGSTATFANAPTIVLSNPVYADWSEDFEADPGIIVGGTFPGTSASIMVVTQDVTVVIEEETFNFPKGVYLQKASDTEYMNKFEYTGTVEVVNKINAKYIPSDTSKLDATKCTFQTTAPTAAISDGGVHIVYLSAEPTTKYDGYIYLIAEA